MTEMEKSIKKAVESFARNITASEDEAIKNYPELASAIKGVGLDNPESFNLFVPFQIEKAMTAVLMEEFKTANKPRDIAWLYQHYDFMNNKIAKYITIHTGGAACVDQSRYILKGYLEYLKTGKVFTLGNRKDYWVPDFGTPQQWLDFCRAAVDSYYSNISASSAKAMEEMNKVADQYVKQRQAEEQAYQDKLHRSVIDFRMLMDLKIPVILKDNEEGRMFCELLDNFAENTAHENLTNFYINSTDGENIVTVSGKGIEFIKKEEWTGRAPVRFETIRKEK